VWLDQKASSVWTTILYEKITWTYIFPLKRKSHKNLVIFVNKTTKTTIISHPVLTCRLLFSYALNKQIITFYCWHKIFTCFPTNKTLHNSNYFVSVCCALLIRRISFSDSNFPVYTLSSLIFFTKLNIRTMLCSVHSFSHFSITSELILKKKNRNSCTASNVSTFTKFLSVFGYPSNKSVGTFALIVWCEIHQIDRSQFK
jgi:hypothetical protein